MAQMTHDYYFYAEQDFMACKALYEAEIFNSVGSHASEAVEKYMKHIIQVFDIGDEELLHSHNLKALSLVVKKNFKDFDFTTEDLGEISGLYFDMRYPSNSPYDIDKDISEKLLNIVEKIKASTDRILGME